MHEAIAPRAGPYLVAAPTLETSSKATLAGASAHGYKSRVDASPRRRFSAAFARWSRRVRRRLALELILTGAAAGMALGAAGAAAAWQTRHGALRPWMAAGG
ncbi:MAG TPA: hypothetical protein VL242_50600, partial [Sorangium sp.]|nr:hypothetical protein [Sorangium sp.]